jgi:hypothetical protein
MNPSGDRERLTTIRAARSQGASGRPPIKATQRCQSRLESLHCAELGVLPFEDCATLVVNHTDPGGLRMERSVACDADRSRLISGPNAGLILDSRTGVGHA